MFPFIAIINFGANDPVYIFKNERQSYLAFWCIEDYLLRLVLKIFGISSTKSTDIAIP